MKNKLLSLIGISLLIGGSMASTANAAILFQDDAFHEIPSEAIMIDSDGAGANNTAIKFGNDATASENGNITYNITTNSFAMDHTLDITGGLSATGAVNFSGATQVRLREDADPATNAACANIGEVIIDTTDRQLQICTATGTPGTWSAVSSNADLFDGLDSTQFLRSDTSDAFTSGTLTFNSGTTLDVNGAADFGGATSFTIVNGAANPGTCSEGQLFYNTTTNVLNVCTAANTWSAAGPQDFESIYAADADKTLTTSNGNFTINAGTGTFQVTNTGGVIDFDATTFNVDTAGAFSIDGNGASNVGTTAGNLTLSTTTSGNVALNAADDVTVTAGDDVLLDDAQLSAPIQLTSTATGWAATLTGGGIIDNINSFTLTTAGDGASNVGVNDAGGYFTGADVEAALQELGAVSGSNADNSEVLSFSPEYPDAVINQDGSNNKGKLESDFDATNNEHYYQWTTQQSSAQDIDIRFRFPLPADFASVNDFTYKFRTGTAVEANNDVEIGVYNATDLTTGSPTKCGEDTTNVSTTWATGTVAKATIETGCTGGTALGAGDLVEVLVHMIDATSASGTFANIGNLNLGYNN